LWIFSLLLNHFNYYFIFISISFLIIFLIINKFYKLNKIFIIFTIGIFFILPNFSFFQSNFNKTDSDWLDFNSVNIQELIKENNIIFVDVTAEWCATCQFNKINVLKNSLIKDAFLKYNVVKVRADWTKPNKKIEKFLQNNKKFGIPYNVIYDKNNIDGIDLSELLSSNEIIEILNNL
jgi:suppressor for copper-sensitivity B